MSVVLGAENKDVRANIAAQMLNRGFSMMNSGDVPVTVSSPVAPVVQNTNPTPTTMAAAYNTATANTMPKYTAPAPAVKSSGNAGVQFGAFSSTNAASVQVKNVKSKLGIDAIVEPTGTGMYRVRKYGLTESDAQKIKASATNHGIDSYVFH
jgi:cell division septation protein DedD